MTTTLSNDSFNARPILKYLSISSEENPSPSEEPIAFLSKHLQQLPPQLLQQFSSITTPRERSSIVKIRNRRTTWAHSAEGRTKLSWVEARKQDPVVYESHMIAAAGSSGMPRANDPSAPDRQYRRGEEQGLEEREWADGQFLGGASEFKKHVGSGKFGALLGQFEEERESERHRELRRQAREEEEREAAAREEVEEEDDTEEGDDQNPLYDSEEEARQAFERVVRNQFIVGSLKWIDYDVIDYDDDWDRDHEDDEERWFDEEEAN